MQVTTGVNEASSTTTTKLGSRCCRAKAVSDRRSTESCCKPLAYTGSTTAKQPGWASNPSSSAPALSAIGSLHADYDQRS